MTQKQLPLCKLIDISDFDNPNLRKIIEEISQDETIQFGLDKPVVVPDSKQWECAMAIHSLGEKKVIRPGAILAGIGAGTEVTTFYLASKGCAVFPVDRYLDRTPWSDVAPAEMAVDPQRFSSIKYDYGNIVPIHSDARRLNLPSNIFDGVYSSGSIEHFGSVQAMIQALKEIRRVLKPGGYASISSEFRIDGPADREWFDDNCILFTPTLLDKVVRESGLRLANELDCVQSEETFKYKKNLTDFLHAASNIKELKDKLEAYPNLILFHEGFLFCSFHFLLQKPDSPVEIQESTNGEGNSSLEEIRDCRQTLADKLAGLQRGTESDESLRVKTESLENYKQMIENELREIKSENLRLKDEVFSLLNSTSIKITAPLRKLNDIRKGVLNYLRKKS